MSLCSVNFRRIFAGGGADLEGWASLYKTLVGVDTAAVGCQACLQPPAVFVDLGQQIGVRHPEWVAFEGALTMLLRALPVAPVGEQSPQSGERLDMLWSKLQQRVQLQLG